jgi:hypothetical protein
MHQHAVAFLQKKKKKSHAYLCQPGFHLRENCSELP